MPEERISPYRGKESFLFLSYSHRDMDAAMKLLRYLIGQGVRIWYDEGIDPGTEFNDTIAERIGASDGMIALISEHFLQSGYCKDELQYARTLEKARLLIYAESVELPPGMAMRHGRSQAIHQYSYPVDEQFHRKLMEAPIIQRNLSKEPEQTPEPGHTPAPAPVPTPSVAPAQHESKAEAPVVHDGWLPEREEIRLDDHTYFIYQMGACGPHSRTFCAYDAAWPEIAHALTMGILPVRPADDFFDGERAKHRVIIKQFSGRGNEERAVFTNARLQRDLMELRHKNLARLVQVCNRGSLCLVTEYVEGPTVRTHYFSTLTQVYAVMIDVLHALEALHSRRICYGNITLDNVMIRAVPGQEPYALLTDYSEASYAGEDALRDDLYMAGQMMSELLDRQKRYGFVVEKSLRDRLFGVPSDEERSRREAMLMARCATAKNKNDRYQSVGEMLEDLTRAIELLNSDVSNRAIFGR